MKKLKYTIPRPPVTKKNHQQIRRTSTGKPFIAQSDQYKAYEQTALWYIKPPPEKPIDYPVEVTARFYMPTRRRVDLTNLLEAIDDILVAAHILADDNSSILVSHDGSRVYYDKTSPRTEITIRRLEE